MRIIKETDERNEIIHYDIDYDKSTGYFVIVDSNGEKYGQFLDYDDALRKINSLGMEETETSFDLGDYVKEWAESDREAGHPVEDYQEFSKICKDDGVEPSESLYNLYLDYYESDSDSEGEESSNTPSSSKDDLIRDFKKTTKLHLSTRPNDNGGYQEGSGASFSKIRRLIKSYNQGHGTHISASNDDIKDVTYIYF